MMMLAIFCVWHNQDSLWVHDEVQPAQLGMLKVKVGVNQMLIGMADKPSREKLAKAARRRRFYRTGQTHITTFKARFKKSRSCTKKLFLHFSFMRPITK